MGRPISSAIIQADRWARLEEVRCSMSGTRPMRVSMPRSSSLPLQTRLEHHVPRRDEEQDHDQPSAPRPASEVPDGLVSVRASRVVSMERPAPVRIYVDHPHWGGRSQHTERSRPWPVARVVHPSIWGWTSTRTRFLSGSCLPASKSHRSSGSPMTRYRSAGSWPGSPNPRLLRACYQPDPTGFELARLLASTGVRCDVIAPTLIPKAPGDKARDRHPRLPTVRPIAPRRRAGCIRIPTPAEEAARDLCRTRSDMVQDLTRARNRLGKFLLRHGRVWRGGSTWTLKHQAWLGSQRFDEPAMTQTFGHYLAVVEVRNVQLDAVEADLVGWCDRPRSTGRSPGWPPTGASPGWAR